MSFSYSIILMITPPPISTLFPYTTLFRSNHSRLLGGCARAGLRLSVRRWRCGKLRLRTGQSRGVRGSDPQGAARSLRSEEHTSELQSRFDLVCRLLLEKKKKDIVM